VGPGPGPGLGPGPEVQLCVLHVAQYVHNNNTSYITYESTSCSYVLRVVIQINNITTSTLYVVGVCMHTLASMIIL